ncbi:MAG TPA: hypothetical protein VJA66_10305, partial [Thermoanaerobaculia bacterium]
ANTTDVVAAIEDILKLGRLSKFDYFSRSLADVFVGTPDPTPYTALIPEASRDEMNPSNTPAAKSSQNLDLTGPDRINDAEYNRILWSMLKSGEPYPATRSRAPLHILQMNR